jgi:hypothetical protein
MDSIGHLSFNARFARLCREDSKTNLNRSARGSLFLIDDEAKEIEGGHIWVTDLS